MHGRPQDFFSKGGKIRGLGAKVPQRGPGMEPQWGSGGEAPEPTTGCENSAHIIRQLNALL